MKLIIIDNYDSFTFNLYQMLVPLLPKPQGGAVAPGRRDLVSLNELRDASKDAAEAVWPIARGALDSVEVFRNDEIDFETLKKMKPDGIVLSPGPGHPGNDRDFGVCADIILKRKDLGASVLGVCLGHQGIVHHMGGKVVRAPEIVHGKVSTINITDETALLKGLGKSFSAMRYHSLVASEESFPEVLRVTARESSRSLIMALEHRSEPIFGVQFHPESIGTPLGTQILQNFVEMC